MVQKSKDAVMKDVQILLSKEESVWDMVQKSKDADMKDVTT